MTGPDTGEIGYRIVLPPGWARIPLRSGTDEAIEAILEAVGAEPSARREEAAAALRQAAKAAREGNGVHLYMPVVARYGQPIGASFVVAEVAFGALEPLDPGALVAGLARGGDRLIVDGVVAARAEADCAADPARGAPLPSRRVDYVLPVPEDPDRYVVITFSVLRTPDDLAPELMKLFDAVMTTFRWTGTTPV